MVNTRALKVSSEMSLLPNEFLDAVSFVCFQSFGDIETMIKGQEAAHFEVQGTDCPIQARGTVFQGHEGLHLALHFHRVNSCDSCRKISLALCYFILEEKTQSQRGQISHPRAHSQEAEQPGSKGLQGKAATVQVYSLL